jgi:glycolate oxidase FAD binding subunit
MAAANQTLAARDAADVAEAVGWANAQGKAIAVEGGGSKAGVGCPFAADLTLSLAGLSGVIDYEPSELVLTAQAGAPLAEIEALLATRGQQLAFEPIDHGPLFGAPAGRATLGGIIAANVSGPRRIKVGAARDHFLGFAGVSGRGEAFKAGGKVVKNVTGYDLAKLMAGSWGTLAVLTEVTVKVMPRAPRATTLLVAGAADETAVKVMSAALGAQAEVTGVAHLPAALALRAPVAALTRAGAAITAIRVEGVGPGMTASAWAIGGALSGLDMPPPLDDEDTARLWRWIGEAAAFAAGDDQVWRLSLAPTLGPAAVAAIRAQIAAEAFYDWGGGLVWLSCADTGPVGQVVRDAVAALGGHATLVRASPATRAAIGAFQPEPAALAALSRRVKASFDPQGVLNPGRLWPLAPAKA